MAREGLRFDLETLSRRRAGKKRHHRQGAQDRERGDTPIVISRSRQLKNRRRCGECDDHLFDMRPLRKRKRRAAPRLFTSGTVWNPELGRKLQQCRENTPYTHEEMQTSQEELTSSTRSCSPPTRSCSPPPRSCQLPGRDAVPERELQTVNARAAGKNGRACAGEQRMGICLNSRKSTVSWTTSSVSGRLPRRGQTLKLSPAMWGAPFSDI